MAITVAERRRLLRPRRDYVTVPGDPRHLDMDPVPLPVDPSRCPGRLFRAGARHVSLDGVVDLADVAAAADTVASLVLVREFTAHGFSVRWTARMPDGMRLPMLLGHLHPPQEIIGAAHGAEMARLWSRRFFVGACFWRRGPGFVEVRDHRSAHQPPRVIDDPARLRVMEASLFGTRASAVDADVAAAFEEAGLGHRLGGHFWWLPYRIRRWPFPPMSV